MTALRDPKDLVFVSSKSPSYVGTGDEDHAMDSIIVESGPLAPLALVRDGLSPTTHSADMHNQTYAGMASDDDMVDDDDLDDEDEDNESELLLDIPEIMTDYTMPMPDQTQDIAPEDEERDSTKDVSENSVENSLTLTNDLATPKSDLLLGESTTRGGKLRRPLPPQHKRRKTPMGRSRTPRAPSPIIPPQDTSPWPDVVESDIRHSEDPDSKRPRILRHEPVNGTAKDATTSGNRTSTRNRDEPPISAEERMKRSKRVKISPRKEKHQPNRQRSPPHPLTAAFVRSEEQTGSAGGQPRFILNVKADKDDMDPTRYNEETCGACEGPGRFLCCEGCPKSFHFTCLDPPIDENDLPEDSWYALAQKH
jgi:PHD-finger